MTVLATLKAARALIADEKNWTQGMARPKKGVWDAFSALKSLLPRISIETFHAALAALQGHTPAGSVSKFNSTHTHPEVLGLFDAAIAGLEAKK